MPVPPAETVAQRRPLPPAGLTAAELMRRAGPLAAGSLLPFLLVLYLSLKGGGYDAIVRSEVGIAAWWIVLLAAAVGTLPTARLGRAGWTGLGLLAGFALWTGLGIGWSESAERSAAELARVATLLGVFALALTTQGPDSLRRTVGAIGAAITTVAVLALASRFHPSWFPRSAIADYLPSSINRLSYPVTYWNGLATLMAIGIPLVLWAASSTRAVLARSLAAGALPALALTAFFTLSRGGVVEIAVALAVLLALHPRRLELLPTLLLGAAGSAVLIAGALQRDAIQDGVDTPAALAQGNEMAAMTIVVCAGVALLGAALQLSIRHRVLVIPRISRSRARLGLVSVTLATLLAGLALGAPGELSDRWQEFKAPAGTDVGVARFASASGSGRYQYWQSAIDANASDPLIGIGPGTFEYWWAREGTIPGFVRDAHSLYLETLAELGIVGLALIVALIGGVLGIGARRALRLRGDPRRAALLAAATAGVAAFATAAAVDWAWEMTVLPVAFLVLAATIVGPGSSAVEAPPTQRRRLAPRVVLALLAVGSLIAIALPMAGTASISESQTQANAGQLPQALADARRAADIQPFAASPKLQQALVLELDGDLGGAAAAATQATRDEPTNWRTWLVLSRVEAERGNTGPALQAYRRARSLNPRSPLFAG